MPKKSSVLASPTDLDTDWPSPTIVLYLVYYKFFLSSNTVEYFFGEIRFLYKGYRLKKTLVVPINPFRVDHHQRLVNGVVKKYRLVAKIRAHFFKKKVYALV